jgi:RNA polymerase sporulation-specific sigma factor
MDYKLKGLVEKVKGGDNNSAEELLGKLKPLIISCANKYGNKSIDKEELIQEGYLETLTRIHDYDDSRGIPFLGYLKVRLRYFFMNYFRGEKIVAFSIDKKIRTEEGNISIVNIIPDKEADVFEEYIRNETSREIYNAIDKLSSKQRKVIILYYYKGWKIGEIAKEMKTHYMSVVRLKQRAIKKMREILNKTKVFP